MRRGDRGGAKVNRSGNSHSFWIFPLLIFSVFGIFLSKEWVDAHFFAMEEL